MSRAPRYVAAVALLMLAGCSSPQADQAVIVAAPSPPAADVTTINGQVPPGEPTRIDVSETLLDVVDGDVQHLVYRDIRRSGTRSPIHVHPYGGTTCVTSGAMTLYLEGAEPQTAYAGDCYWMPPGLPMTGVSSGDEDAVMLDTFAVPPGQPVWWIVEPGMADIVDEFGGGGAHM